MRTASVSTGGLTSEQRRLQELEEQRRRLSVRPKSLAFGAGQDRYSQVLALDRQIGTLQGQGGPPAVQGGGGLAGQPQFYGVETTDWDAYEQSLVEQGMAGLRANAGAAGTESSSVFGVAQGQLAAESQRTRLQMETQEKARRTDWEQRQAIQQWQMREGTLSRQQANRQFYAQLKTQQEMALAAQRQAYIQMFGAMDQRDAWNLLGTLGDAYSLEAPSGDIEW